MSPIRGNPIPPPEFLPQPRKYHGLHHRQAPATALIPGKGDKAFWRKVRAQIKASQQG
jgi:hypothetical protein